MPRRFRRPDYYYSFYREPCSDHVFVCVGGPQSTSRKQFGKPRFYERRSVDAACTRAAHENTSQKSVRSPAQKYQLYSMVSESSISCWVVTNHTHTHVGTFSLTRTCSTEAQILSHYSTYFERGLGCSVRSRLYMYRGAA